MPSTQPTDRDMLDAFRMNIEDDYHDFCDDQDYPFEGFTDVVAIPSLFPSKQQMMAVFPEGQDRGLKVVVTCIDRDEL